MRRDGSGLDRAKWDGQGGEKWTDVQGMVCGVVWSRGGVG